MVREPYEHVRSAVYPRVVIVTVGTIDVGAQGEFRGVGLSVLKYSGSRAGHKIDQRLVIAVLIERHLEDSFFGELSVNVGFFGLQTRQGRFDGDLIGEGANLQFGVGIGNRVGLYP